MSNPTFRELGANIRGLGPNQTIALQWQLGELADAMDRFEANAAQMFSDLAINGQAYDTSAALAKLRE